MTMKKAFNTQLLYFFAVSAFFLPIGVLMIINAGGIRDIIIGSVSALAGGYFLFRSFTRPLLVAFSSEEIKITYFFGSDSFLIKDVRKIYVSTVRGDGQGLQSYVINCPREYKKRPFYMNCFIPKTKKTEKLLKEVYKGKIRK